MYGHHGVSPVGMFATPDSVTTTSHAGDPCTDVQAQVLVSRTTASKFLWQPEVDGKFVLFSNVGSDCTKGNMQIPVSIAVCLRCCKSKT